MHPDNMVKLIMALLTAWMLQACGGGGGDSSGSTAPTPLANSAAASLNANTVVITAQDAGKLSAVTRQAAGKKTLTLAADAPLLKDLAVGKVVYLPGGRDSRYPFGLSGKVTALTPRGGQVDVVLTPVLLTEVFDKINEHTVETVSPANVLGVIAAPGAEVSMSFAPAAPVAAVQSTGFWPEDPDANPRITGTDGANGASFKLNYDRVIYDRDDNLATKGDQVVLSVTYEARNLVVEKDLDYDVKRSGEPLKSFKMRTRGITSFSATLKGNMKLPASDGSAALANAKAWDALEKAAFNQLGIDFTAAGLDGVDKQGRLPLVGIPINARTPVAPGAGANDSKLAETRPGGFILWVSLASDGTVELGGEDPADSAELAVRQNPGNLDFGVESMFNTAVKRFELSGFNRLEGLNPQENLLEAPILKGKVRLEQRFGVTTEVDAFLGGARFANTAAFVGESSRLSGLVEGGMAWKSLDSPLVTGKGCWNAEIGAGLIATAQLRMGDGDTHGFRQQFPAETGREGLNGSTWYRTQTPLSEEPVCFNVPVLSPGFDYAVTALDNNQVTVVFNIQPTFSLTAPEDIRRWEFLVDGVSYTPALDRDHVQFVHDFPVSSPAAHVVVLRVTDKHGQIRSIKKTLALADIPPLVDFSWDAVKCRTVTFRATAQVMSYPDVNSVRMHQWDFGDGTPPVSAGGTVSHTYAGCGSYQVSLQVTDALQLQSSRSKTIDTSNIGVVVNRISLQPASPRFGQPVRVELEGKDLPPDLKLACQSCLDGVSQLLSESTASRRIYVFTPRTLSMDMSLNDMLSIAESDDNLLARQAFVVYAAGIDPVEGGLLNDTGITDCYDSSSLLGDCATAGLGLWGGLNQDGEAGRDALAAQGRLAKTGGGRGGFDFTKVGVNGEILPESAASWHCVRDNHTGLMWEVKTDDGGYRDKDNVYTWFNADSDTNGGFSGVENGGGNTQAFVEKINLQGLCGFQDWRLPSRSELVGLVDYGKPVTTAAAIEAFYFPNTMAGAYASSSPVAGNGQEAWIVSFDFGYAGNFSKRGLFHVRVVRSLR
ncbi:MAG: DUF1566 domain-containing protein [Fluviicoccus sp.]|uniref:Lcl domain-containing protein n=1 Tax=Fluviicoccus sp. TaxID=2003552 RepID=UPI002724040B|nr:DUF1566 domain-containing protein [Fluviicoccus sp.]MDO8332253.1 DUF1566 domain-containing protein [Fluviicoccus sp.]